MEEAQKADYTLSQADKDNIDNILVILSSSSDETKLEEVAVNLANKLFLPFRDARVRSIKSYFVQKEGPKILIEGIKSAQQNKDLRDTLISACRYFGEASELHMEIIRAGALPLITSLVNSDERHAKSGFHWLWNILEVEELLDLLAEQGVPDLLLQKASEIENRMQLMNTLAYRCELFACLQCGSINEKFRAVLWPVLNSLLALLDNYKYYDSSSISQQQRLGLNHIAVFAANMAIGERVRNSNLKYRVFVVLRLIRKFNPVVTVAEAEFNVGYACENPKIYLPIIETDMIDVQRFGAYVMAGMSTSGKSFTSQLMFAEYTRSRMIEQNLVERIRLLTFSKDPETQSYALQALREFNTTGLNVPSLKMTCYWHLMMSCGVETCRKILQENNINY